jgi:NADH:ubiquinone reductase (H+-translocating)
MSYKFNAVNSCDQLRLPINNKKRIVIVGGGFAGLTLARKLADKYYQVVLVDKNNFHQFQPLFYQVATSGLEPSAISFPFRKIFQDKSNVHFRMAEVLEVDTSQRELLTSIGAIPFDYLVLAMGATTNYYNNANIEKYSLPMKSVSEALQIRNLILQHYENAMNTNDDALAIAYMNIVIVGGGPTGVELVGAIAEMKKYVLPKDYPELDFASMKIILCEGSNRLLSAMSEKSSAKALKYLHNLEVDVRLNCQASDFNGEMVTLSNGDTIVSKTMVWAAGIKPNKIKGLAEQDYHKSGRIAVTSKLALLNNSNVYALGDLAIINDDPKYPRGHPQVAQVAIQQAKLLGDNFIALLKNKKEQSFSYKDKGSMATVGRNIALVELPGFRFSGFLAWFVWMFVHLFSIIGIKNKMLIFVNWAWNYLTYDQSLRLLIKNNTRENV